ncbi:MAG: DUF1846 domain-containing protein [Spirochaetales bacterium]|nr:DUF1846 domain-containing protein [Spirochaetales bacterium]
MPKKGFDSQKYITEQASYILERVKKSEGKLYVECGGKLLFDYHAARVLPGFEPSIKMKVFETLKDKIDVIICIYAGDIERRKMRADFGISYDTDVFKMIDDFARYGLKCSRVVITRYDSQPAAMAFKTKLEAKGINVYTHSATPGYPTDIDLIVSDDGYGKNAYIPTEKPIVLVTAPGPGSGKLATCLNQMYHENRMGRKCAYSKFETFPVWNLPLNHPVNVAYEAATVDIGDFNQIDHFHLDAYGQVTVNYNRDLEAFPLLKKILERITGEECIYKSPTDMGVNRVGFGIIDDEACREAGKQEIIRRFFRAQTEYAQGICDISVVEKAKAIMDKVGVSEKDRKVVPVANEALKRAIANNLVGNKGTICTAAIELPDGKCVTSHNSPLMHAGSALILNALKALAGIDQEYDIIAPQVINSITTMKRDVLSGRGVSLNVDEILICLAMSAAFNDKAREAMHQLPLLKGSEVHFTHIPSAGDQIGLRKLGMNVTSNPIFPSKNIYNPL